MGINRRVVLGLLTAGAALPRSARAGRSLGFMSCAARQDRFVAVQYIETGGVVFETELPGRGHAIALRPGVDDAVVLARRPGTFAVVLDRHSGAIRRTLDTPDGLHFYGHGVFSPDGRLLFTTENDYVRGHGVVGIWDASDGYARLGEVPAGGVGPHEIALSRDGRTLLVAIGGIDTHPDSGRAKLNLATMRPGVTAINLRTGRLLSCAVLPENMRKLSLRHLAVSDRGRILIAGQDESGGAPQHALVATLNEPDMVRVLSLPKSILARMNRYCGAAAVAGDMAVVTCPRGNLAVRVHLPTGQAAAMDMTDVCGVATVADGFLLSGGDGGLMLWPVGGRPESLPAVAGLRWDNHLTPI